MSLIDDIRSGSNDAIKQLYQENAQDVYDFAKGITGNHDTAMQATKSTLTKLVQQIQSGDEPANLHSEALKLAYDEACKIAMPSVQNVKSPYEEAPEETVVRKTRQSQSAQKGNRQAAAPSRRAEQYYDEYDYEEDDYEPEPVRRRAPQRGNRRDYEEEQAYRRNSRRDYYEDDYDDRYQRSRYNDRYNDRYDDYDDYDEYEKKGRGAGFYICLLINIILVLLLIWFLLGLLINLGVLPETLSDTLGYTWFDNHIYPLF